MAEMWRDYYCWNYFRYLYNCAIWNKFVYSRSSLLNSNNKKRALVLVGIMWFVLFIVPALKYPANPPAVCDPETYTIDRVCILHSFQYQDLLL
jgi:hypothetical protein